VPDADAAGTLVYQSLQEATRARPGRKVRVVNLGLEPEEALAMELEVEDVDAGERRKPIASYVPDPWQDWLRYHRVELNAMTTPQIAEQILREARLEERVAAALGRINLPLPEDLHAVVDNALTKQPAASWRAAIGRWRTNCSHRIADHTSAAHESWPEANHPGQAHP
jgi:hypothetical protein